MNKIQFLTPAALEFEAAIEFYELEMPGLGHLFVSEVEKSINRIDHFPHGFTSLSHRTRRCLVSKFPYGIIYQYKEAEQLILIIAVANLHRKPNYWNKRL